MLSLLLAKKLFFSATTPLKTWHRFLILSWFSFALAITLLSLTGSLIDAFHSETYCTFKNIQGDFIVYIPKNISETHLQSTLSTIRNAGFHSEILYEIPVMLVSGEQNTFSSAILQTKNLVTNPGEFTRSTRLLANALDPKNGLILGAGLAQELNVKPQDEILLITPDTFANVSDQNNEQGCTTLPLTSILTTGVTDLDDHIAICSKETVERLQIIPDIHQIQIQKPQHMSEKQAQEYLSTTLSRPIHHWIEQYPTLKSMLDMEQNLFLLILLIILLLILLFFPNLFLLLIEQKQTTFSIMVVSGIPLYTIRRTVFLFGLIYIASANIAGFLLAALVCFSNNLLGAIPLPENYYQDSLTLHISYPTIFLLFFASLAIGSMLIWYTIRTITYKKVSSFLKRGLS